MSDVSADIILAPDDLDDLITTVTRLFRTQADAAALLRRIGYPAHRLPNFDRDHRAAWDVVFTDLDAGIVAMPYRSVLVNALRVFPHNPVLVRLSATYLSGASPTPTPARVLRKVLVVGAGPEGSERVRGDRELKWIQRSEAPDHLAVRSCPAATVTDLAAVATFQPDVLHLACHGTGTDLIFEDSVGEARTVPAARVVDLLAQYRARLGVRLAAVVLNSCHSADSAELFRPVADTVVAHRGPLADDCAIAFAGELYSVLRLTPSIADAAHLAAEHVLLAEEPPCPAIKANLVVLTPPTP